MENVNSSFRHYPACKDSRLPWLGRIPAHWEERRARFCFTEIHDRSETGDEELLSVSHITGVTPRSEKNVNMFMAESYIGHKLCQPGDLVINSLWTWMAALGVARQKGIVSSAYGVYRPRAKDLFEPKYLDHLVRIKGYTGEYLCRSKGVWLSRLGLNSDDFFDILIVRPPLDDQRAIVAFLDRKLADVDRYIASKEKLIALLQEQKTALINRAVTRGLNPNVKMKPSGIEWLGEIPEHWEIRRLKYLSPKLSVGLVINPSTYVVDDGTVPFLLGSNVIEEAFKLDDVRRITEESNKSLKSSMLFEDDLVVVRVGYSGVTAVVPKELDRANCASMMIIRKGSKFNSSFLCKCMNSWIGRHQIDTVVYGAAQKQFNVGDAVNFVMPVPPIEEQEAIANRLNQEFQNVDFAVAHIKRDTELIREYRTTLISDAVTGKIDVRQDPQSL